MQNLIFRCSSIIGACTLVLSGCAQLQPDFGHQLEASEQVSRVDAHSSFPAVRRINFEQINIVELVDPEGRAASMFKHSWDGAEKYTSERRWGVQYDLVLNWFRMDRTAGEDHKRSHRNSVQDRIMSVSTSRCNVFKTYLRRQQTDVNFLLGAATTAAGALGAVLPGVRASRNLAATAGLLSGTQAEYNNAYYSNLAANVIVQGIEMRQAKLQKELIQARQGKSIADYSMEAAINDAIVFDGSCSTVVGLIEAAESIKEVSNPGLARVAEVIASVRAANEIAQADKISVLANSGSLAKLLKQAAPTTSPLVVSAVKPEDAAGKTAVSDLEAASHAKERIDASIDEAASRVAQSFEQAQLKLKAEERSTDVKADDAARALGSAVRLAIKDLPVAECTNALVAPAKRLGSAQLAAQLLPKDDASKIAADQELAAARVTAQAAVRRVDLLVRAALDAASTGASNWTTEFSKPKLTKDQLSKLSIPATPPSLKTICAGAG
jgi:hypothetical protein